MARNDDRQTSRDKRLSELGALAKIFAEFQGPQIDQARLQQQAEQGNTNAMLSALGLMQQRTEATARAAEAQARNDIAMRQLGLTERQVAGEESLRPLQMRQGEEEILGSVAKRELAPRLAATDEEKNRLEREKLSASTTSATQNRIVDILEMLTKPETSPESRALIGQGVQGQPGMEGVTQALSAREAQRQQGIEAGRAPALAAQQRVGSAPPTVPLQNLPGEVFGRSVVDFIPNLANTVNPMAEGALGALGMRTNLGRVPSWWEAYKRLVTPQPTR